MRHALSFLLVNVVWTSVLAVEQQILKQGRDFELDEDFDKKVNAVLGKYHVPGLALAIVDDERTFAKGYGFQSLPSSPVTPETLFFTGSTTKAFTAGAASKLVDSTDPKYAHIRWSTPLADIIRDDFVLQDSYYSDHVTLEDALSHRSGMPPHDMIWLGIENLQPNEVVQKFRHLPLTAEIRTTFQYCNLMYAAVGHAIETVTDTWLGDFLREQIWEPLQMNSTYFKLSDALAGSAPDLATGYEWSNATQSMVKIEWPYIDAVSGAGAIISNVLDYSRWIRSLFNRNGPFTDAAYTKFITAHSMPDPVFWKGSQQRNSTLYTGGELYGLGWEILHYGNELLIQHSGGIMGFGTTLMYLPGRKWGFVAMTNMVNEGNIAGTRIGFQLLDDLLGTPEAERVNWDVLDHKRETGRRQQLDQSCSYLYPSLPDPPLPPTLPLDYFTGTYSHDAYPLLILYPCSSDALKPVCPKFATMTPSICGTFPGIVRREFNITFSHASGDFWFAEAQLGSNSEIISVMSATFEISPTGTVARLGIGFEPYMGREGKIWYHKSADQDETGVN